MEVRLTCSKLLECHIEPLEKTLQKGEISARSDERMDEFKWSPSEHLKWKLHIYRSRLLQRCVGSTFCWIRSDLPLPKSWKFSRTENY